MAKEILLYEQIYSYSAERFITALEEARNEDITVRIGCDGGNPEDGWGMIAKLSEHSKGKKIKVDGKAYSMATYLLCYVEEATCLDVTEFLIHRAAYSKWYEQSDMMTDSMWANLDRINASLRKALEAKIDVEAFEEMKGVKLDEIFANESRVDVFLNAKEARKIGLVNKVVSLTPKKQQEIAALANKVAASYNVGERQTTNHEPRTTNDKPQTTDPHNTNINSNKMTLEKLKAEHPEVYANAVKVGVDQERDRVGAWMAYADVDIEAVTKGVEEGTPLTQKTTAELSRKMLNVQALNNLENDSQEGVTTGPVKEPKAEGGNGGDNKEKEDAEVETFRTGLHAKLGLQTYKN